MLLLSFCSSSQHPLLLPQQIFLPTHTLLCLPAPLFHFRCLCFILFPCRIFHPARKAVCLVCSCLACQTQPFGLFSIYFTCVRMTTTSDNGDKKATWKDWRPKQMVSSCYIGINHIVWNWTSNKLRAAIKLWGLIAKDQRSSTLSTSAKSKYEICFFAFPPLTPSRVGNVQCVWRRDVCWNAACMQRKSWECTVKPVTVVTLCSLCHQQHTCWSVVTCEWEAECRWTVGIKWGRGTASSCVINSFSSQQDPSCLSSPIYIHTQHLLLNHPSCFNSADHEDPSCLQHTFITGDCWSQWFVTCRGQKTKNRTHRSTDLRPNQLLKH